MNMNGRIDRHCIMLCNAINEIKGLRTKFCCSGHKYEITRYCNDSARFHIVIQCADNLPIKQTLPITHQLWPVVYSSKKYGFSPHKWKLETLFHPTWRTNCISLSLECTYTLKDADKVYASARMIAMGIRKFLRDKKLVEKYKIQTEKKPHVCHMNQYGVSEVKRVTYKCKY